MNAYTYTYLCIHTVLYELTNAHTFIGSLHIRLQVLVANWHTQSIFVSFHASKDYIHTYLSCVTCRYLNLPKADLTYNDLTDLVKRTKPNRGITHLWKSLLTKGYLEMPSKEHFS